MAPPDFITRIFGRSPIEPLERHIRQAAACASELRGFFGAVAEGDWSRAAEHQQRIVELEHEADRIKNEIRLHLPKGLFLAVGRRDVLELLQAQDTIANVAKDISGLVLGRHLPLPAPLQPPFKAFLERCLEACTLAERIVSELEELLAAGFQGQEAGHVLDMIQELRRIEHDTDELQVSLRAECRAVEETLSPVDAIFLYRVIELTGELANTAQQAGDRLQLMIAR